MQRHGQDIRLGLLEPQGYERLLAIGQRNTSGRLFVSASGFVPLAQVINMDAQRQVAYRLEADLINNSGALSSLEQRALTNIFNRFAPSLLAQSQNVLACTGLCSPFPILSGLQLAKIYRRNGSV